MDNLLQSKGRLLVT